MNPAYPVVSIDLALMTLSGIALVSTLIVAVLGYLLRKETAALRKLVETLVNLLDPARLYGQEVQLRAHEDKLRNHEQRIENTEHRIAKLEGQEG